MSIKAGATSQTIPIYITDTAGAALTGLVFNSAGLTCYYVRPAAVALVVPLVTLAAANSAWASGGFKEIDATNIPGWYRFDIPNAVIASGATSVGIHFKGASGMSPLPLKIDLVAYDPQDTVRLGLTALPNAVAGSTPGLPLKSDLVAASSSTRILVAPLRSGRTDAVRYTRGANAPILRDWMVDGNGERIDLTGYTITVAMITTDEVSVFTGRAASLGNAPEEGQVEFDWNPGDLNTIGQYKVLWSATLGSDIMRFSTLVTVE